MSVQVTIGEVDVRKVVMALKGYDKTLHRETMRSVRRSARSILRTAKANIPANPPMTGWRRTAPLKGRTRGGAGWPGWDQARTRISIRTGRQSYNRRTRVLRWDLVRIEARNADAAIYEFAKNSRSGVRGQYFVTNLNRYALPPRAIWPAVDQHREMIERDIIAAVSNAADIMNRQLG